MYPSRTKKYRWLFIIAGLLIVSLVGAMLYRSCRSEPELAAPSFPPLDDELAVPPYAVHLKGVKICIDPGHGGRANRKGFKRGPTGLREAEVNLRVALFLRDMLEAAGAQVFMTRTEDIYLAAGDDEDLRLRTKIANDNKVDIFLSIHHNASSREDANFVSIWYHGGVDHSPASLDISRHLAVSLIDTLRLPETSVSPLLSDQQMYSNGFAVLRRAEVPAVLAECSFYSNREEEQRLRHPDYNRREAHALFIGLARYAYYGIPRATLVEPADGVVRADGDRKVIVHLDDGITRRRGWGHDRQLIPTDSIHVRLDGNEDKLPFTYDPRNDQISVELPSRLRTGSRMLHVQFQNLYRHANTRPALEFTVR